MGRKVISVETEKIYKQESIKKKKSNTIFNQDCKYVYIPDEDGNDVEFEVIMYFEIEKSHGRYIIATPTFEDTDEAYAFKIYEDDDESDIFVALEDDDEEFSMVLETYERIMHEM